MACSNGSEKKQGAPNFINPNDIGVLCFLFGLEGNLCRLLDLLPEAVKKVAQLNPDLGNADEVFGDILKKVAKRSLGLIIDEFTGQINVEDFCQIEPPEQPPDITFQDVFRFMAEVVTILDYFFQFTDVITGDSTTILDKIVKIWLRKKWFENCECKRRRRENDESLENGLITPECPSVGVFEANQFIQEINEANALAVAEANEINGSANQTASERVNEIIQLFQETGLYTGFRTENENIEETEPVYVFSSFFFGCVIVEVKGREPRTVTNTSIAVYATVIQTSEEVFIGRGQDLQFIPREIETFPDISGCDCGITPSNPNPDFEEGGDDQEGETKFCELFPDDPLCRNDDCESLEVDIEVVEFAGCGQPRTIKIVQLKTDGDIQSCEVVEFAGCSQERQSKIIQYLECNQ